MADEKDGSLEMKIFFIICALFIWTIGTWEIKDSLDFNFVKKEVQAAMVRTTAGIVAQEIIDSDREKEQQGANSFYDHLDYRLHD